MVLFEKRNLLVPRSLQREYNDDHGDDTQEQYTGSSCTESESPILYRLREIVSERCSEGTCDDIGKPKAEDRIDFEHIACSCDHGDDACKYHGRREIPE